MEPQLIDCYNDEPQGVYIINKLNEEYEEVLKKNKQLEEKSKYLEGLSNSEWYTLVYKRMQHPMDVDDSPIRTVSFRTKNFKWREKMSQASIDRLWTDQMWARYMKLRVDQSDKLSDKSKREIIYDHPIIVMKLQYLLEDIPNEDCYEDYWYNISNKIDESQSDSDYDYDDPFEGGDEDYDDFESSNW